MILESDHQIVGFVSLCTSRDEDTDPKHSGEISAIYLLPDVWYQGFGKKLCEAALSELEMMGFSDVQEVIFSFIKMWMRNVFLIFIIRTMFFLFLKIIIEKQAHCPLFSSQDTEQLETVREFNRDNAVDVMNAERYRENVK